MVERGADIWDSFMDEDPDEIGGPNDDMWQKNEEFRIAQEQQLIEDAKEGVKEYYGKDF